MRATRRRRLNGNLHDRAASSRWILQLYRSRDRPGRLFTSRNHFTTTRNTHQDHFIKKKASTTKPQLNLKLTGWSAYGPSRAHRYHNEPELNWTEPNAWVNPKPDCKSLPSCLLVSTLNYDSHTEPTETLSRPPETPRTILLSFTQAKPNANLSLSVQSKNSQYCTMIHTRNQQKPLHDHQKHQGPF